MSNEASRACEALRSCVFDNASGVVTGTVGNPDLKGSRSSPEESNFEPDRRNHPSAGIFNNLLRAATENGNLPQAGNGPSRALHFEQHMGAIGKPARGAAPKPCGNGSGRVSPPSICRTYTPVGSA